MENAEKLVLNEDVKALLEDNQIGLWRVEIEEGKPFRFFADKKMDELLGIEGDVTPEERYAFHHNHILEEDLEMFMEYSDSLAIRPAEATYRYIHPIYGEMYVRCSGRREASQKPFMCFHGTHVDISEAYRLEKDKVAEKRLAQKNKQLQDEKDALQLQYDLIEALSRETENIFILDITERTSTVIKSQGIVIDEKKRSIRSYDDTWVYYINKYVSENDGEWLLEATKIENVVLALDKMGEARYKYKLDIDGEFINYQVTYNYFGDRQNGKVVFGFRCIDDIVFAEQEQNRILEKALEEVEKANSAKTVFVNNMSHDIRTPLNAILGFAQLMASEVENPEVIKDYIEKIEDSGYYLLSLINNVLDMARIDSGNAEIDENIEDFSKIDEDLGEMFSGVVSKKKLNYTQVVDVKNKFVWVDKVKLKEIYMNLISNAIKYTGDGGSVSISLLEVPCEKENYASYEISVSDTGIGMSKEFQKHIFESFSRERSTTDSKVIGTGLGMAIVKKYVDLMGGTIDVESELGKGTKFILRFTLKIAENPNAQMNAKPDNDGSFELKGKRVLLAEDNDMNALIAIKILEGSGVVVERACDGVICVDMFSKAEDGYYDLILMDIEMPNMNGYQATMAIRSFPEEDKANVPIIAMTANAFEEDKKKAFEVGMNAHLSKPIKIKEMRSLIADFL